MTAIASYYASVGVGIDPKSLQNVQRYLDAIQAKMVKFQKNAFKTSNLSLRLNNFTVNQASLRRAINTAVASQRISLRNFHVSQKELMSAINKVVNVQGRSSRIRIGALLSQGSLAEMRNQVRQAINQLVVNPTINPRVRVTRTGAVQGQGMTGSGGTRPNRFTTRDPRSMNPWHNPMMIGGATGAFLRYGMFSLPFVAGAYGLNALSQNMTRLEGHNIMLTTATQSPRLAKEQFEVVDRISSALGLKTSDILPFYAQMFAGARGTTLEQELPASFQGFMEYAMAMGVNNQQLEGGIRAISQAISKGAIYSEEWRQQLAEQGFPEAMNILADVAAGGDRDKLRKMMEQGQVDVYKYLPLVFEEMRKRAQIGLGEYYNSILYQQRRVERANEAFLRTFMDAGASEGMLAVYRAFAQAVEDSIPLAEWFGDAFRRAGHVVSAAIVAPKEFFDWMRGQENEGNFMTLLFGPSGESGFVQAVRYTFEQVKNFITASMEASRKSVEGFTNQFSVLNDIIAPLLEDIGKLLELGAAYQRGGISGLAEKNMQIENRGRARDMAEQEALGIYQRTGVKVPRADILSRADEIYRSLEQDRLNNPEGRSWWQRFQFNAIRADKEIGIVDPMDRVVKWVSDGIKGLFSSPEVNPNPVPYSEGTRLGQTSPYIGTPMSSVEIVRQKIENMQPVPDYGPFVTPLANHIPPEVKITISGGITVDGELGTMIDNTNLSEKFNEQIEQMLYGTRPQFSVVHR